jgi:hypothetical protein
MSTIRTEDGAEIDYKGWGAGRPARPRSAGFLQVMAPGCADPRIRNGLRPI